MPYFSSSYVVKWFGQNGAYVLAEDKEEAIVMMELRGIGEELSQYSAPFNDPPDNQMPLITFLLCPYITNGQKLHAISWTCFLAMGCKLLSNEEIHGDGGIIHAVAHEWERVEHLSSLSSGRSSANASYHRLWGVSKDIPGYVFTPYLHDSTRKLMEQIRVHEEAGGNATSLYL